MLNNFDIFDKLKGDLDHPTIFEVLCDLRRFGINPNRFDKLWRRHRRELGRHVRIIDGKIHTILSPQSGTTEDQNISLIPKSTTVQNVAFSDQAEAYTMETESFIDETRTFQDNSDAELGNFFSRPIKIHSVEWGTGTTLFSEINPWKLYFENPRVSNRIANYNLMRAKLHLKVVVNGNGFQYGRAIAYYHPMHVFDTVTSNASLVSETIVQGSQMPHIFINPTMSSGGDLILPFFNYYNMISVPESEWEVLGQLIIRSINPLKHANGASDQVTVSVFAWAEDVSMSILTSREPNTLVPQSGEIDEANEKGFISGPATAISNAAAALSKLPWIGPYAMATATVSNNVAKVAKVLGYSRPSQTENPCPYRPTLISSLANTTVPDTVEKLTVDDKQELSIDPRIVGLGPGDPMQISDIAKRESYLTTFNWTIGTAPETMLWNARVDPVTWAFNTGNSSFHFPACAMAALPFRYWTGTMNFRFQIVCSSFHKGRLKVVYDPGFIATNEYNTNYLKVIDIADENDFTISVSNGQDRTMLDHHYPGVDVVSQMYSTTPYTAQENGNGVVGVYVVNELTTPNSVVNNDIQVNVYVSMGDDFEVFVPDDHFQNFVLKPQSGVLFPQSGDMQVADSENTSERDKPQHEQSTMISGPPDPLTHTHKVFAGEAIKSFRPLLKRYNLHTALSLNDSVATHVYSRRAIFPFCRGNVANAIHSTTLAAPYNYCNTLLLHWVTWAHSGWRGSIRYKALPVGHFDTEDKSTIYVDRFQSSSGYNLGADFATTPSTFSNFSTGAKSAVKDAFNSADWRKRSPTGYNGAAFRTNEVNGAMEFEIPFYSTDRFVPGKWQDWTGAGYSNRRFVPGWNLRWQTVGNTRTKLDIHTAAGEDFQVYFFTGLPPLYYEASPP